VKLSIEPSSQDEELQLERVSTSPSGWEHLSNARDSTDPKHPYVHIVDIEQISPNQTVILDYVGRSKTYIPASYLAVKAAAREYKEMVRPGLGLIVSANGPEYLIRGDLNANFDVYSWDPFGSVAVITTEGVQRASSLWEGAAIVLPTLNISSGGLSEPRWHSYSVAQQGVVYTTRGIGFTPYVDDQNPIVSAESSDAELMARLESIGNNTVWVRSFGTVQGLEKFGTVSLNPDLKQELAENNFVLRGPLVFFCASSTGYEQSVAGVNSATSTNINVRNINRGAGSWQIYMQPSYAKSPARTIEPRSLSPTIASYNWDRTPMIGLANYYPYWKRSNITGLSVIMSEIGWSSGQVTSKTMPSLATSTCFLNFACWARVNNPSLFYFETLAETWKVNDNAPEAAGWGVWEPDGDLKDPISTRNQRLQIKVLGNGQTRLEVQTIDDYERSPSRVNPPPTRAVKVKILESGGSQLSVSSSVSTLQSDEPVVAPLSGKVGLYPAVFAASRIARSVFVIDKRTSPTMKKKISDSSAWR
jgi:hypothetical protein